MMDCVDFSGGMLVGDMGLRSFNWFGSGSCLSGLNLHRVGSFWSRFHRSDNVSLGSGIFMRVGGTWSLSGSAGSFRRGDNFSLRGGIFLRGGGTWSLSGSTGSFRRGDNVSLRGGIFLRGGGTWSLSGSAGSFCLFNWCHFGSTRSFRGWSNFLSIDRSCFRGARSFWGCIRSLRRSIFLRLCRFRGGILLDRSTRCFRGYLRSICLSWCSCLGFRRCGGLHCWCSWHLGCDWLSTIFTRKCFVV